jgi:hypothetical protein
MKGSRLNNDKNPFTNANMKVTWYDRMHRTMLIPGPAREMKVFSTGVPGSRTI